MRKTCKETKDLNPNWKEKVVLAENNRYTEKITEIFKEDSCIYNKSYEDSMLSCGGLNLAYTCTSITE